MLLLYEYQVKCNLCLSYIDIRVRLYLCYQIEEQSLSSYFQEFKARLEVVKTVDRSIRVRREGGLYESIEELFANVTGDVLASDKGIENWNNNYMLAVLLIRNACNKRYGSLKRNLQNQYNKGID
jgi:hypothetical protein